MAEWGISYTIREVRRDAVKRKSMTTCKTMNFRLSLMSGFCESIFLKRNIAKKSTRVSIVMKRSGLTVFNMMEMFFQNKKSTTENTKLSKIHVDTITFVTLIHP